MRQGIAMLIQRLGKGGGIFAIDLEGEIIATNGFGHIASRKIAAAI
jgi:hypothetical protein